jgi:subtilisin family serine protease
MGETTGRFVVTFSDEVEGDSGEITQALESVAGVSSVASTLDFESGALDVDEAGAADATVFAELGVAVVSADPTDASAISGLAATDDRIVAVEPERILYAIEDIPPSSSLDYLRGYRDAASHLYEQLAGTGTGQAQVDTAARGFLDSSSFTWGLQATRASSSAKTGQGVAVAVLDTGMDLAHPDFAGRPITSKSFVSGQTPQDGHGHGTHCVGTSCGPKSPSGSRRYGVATGANVFVGKVLSNQGSGSDSGILAGMNWAIANRVPVISMSLGADVAQVSTAYETVGRRALRAGTLIVAAAGNNARRSMGNNGFVGMPANSPSIMAVGAIDANLRVADFSARSNPVQGGKVDVAAPGVAVYSSWPMPVRYKSISGTSMATPHVAGIAALLIQATGATGAALWSKVVQAAQALSLPSVDVGTGMAQAPQ